MKKFMVLSLFVLSFYACKKSADGLNADDFPSAPEAKPAYDNTSFGVYKGVFLGTPGSFQLNIKNGDDLVEGYVYINNTVVDTMKTTYAFVAGEAIDDAHFAGRTYSFDFSTDANGNNTTITSVNVIGISNPQAFAIHELSYSQVLCFEGRFSGNDRGIFKCMAMNALIKGYAVSEISGETYQASGPVTNNSFNMVFGTVSSGATFSGQFTTIACAGNWQNDLFGESGTFRGDRTR